MTRSHFARRGFSQSRDWRSIAFTLTVVNERNGLVSTIEAAARSYDLSAFAFCGRAKEQDTTKVDIYFFCPVSSLATLPLPSRNCRTDLPSD
jgi:hypothetical protein